MKKVGILELCANVSTGLREDWVALLERKQFVSLTPQAVAVWCRQQGHRVHYAAYIGLGDPMRLLPDDLDVVFITAHTCVAPLAYAVAQVYRRQGTRTVLGGPHAKSFPRDALRYFDVVVRECDQALIADIVADRFEPGSVVSSPAPYADTPTIEERLPELRESVFWRGRPGPVTIIPMLASVGCPYTCNFCADWNSPYRALSTERLAEDLRFASEQLPGVMLFFYDPNFGIRFDETLRVFEGLPAGQHNPYLIETSLANLRSPERLQRLRETNCRGVAPGIESWTEYSNKAAVGKSSGREKLERVADHIRALHDYVPYVQANFIMGLDNDAGAEPFELTKEFLLRSPFVWPTLNIPMAFGGTPLYSSLLKEGRILTTMPFTFYQVPFLTLILKNYSALEYFERMVDLYGLLLSARLEWLRLTARSSRFTKAVNTLRWLAFGNMLSSLQDTLRRLRSDANLRAYHAGQTQQLPEVYARAYRRRLGKYAELMPLGDSQPVFDEEPAQISLSTARPVSLVLDD